MYGKNYESMYEGSMLGAGINVFAVWNWVVTKARGGSIEINPRLLAFTLGGMEDEVVRAIDFLCRPDPNSRSKKEDGRRLVKEGQFQYRVVNWEVYQTIKNSDDLREYNRLKQAEYRERKKVMNGWKAKKQDPTKGKLDAKERRFVKADGDGDVTLSDEIAASDLPRPSI